MSEPISVDVWSDIACPWCYIGKRRFEEGLRRFGDPDAVHLTYHSFELAPDTPTDFAGSEVDFLADYKGIPAEQVQQMLTQVAGLAESEGLTYDFDALKHTNTLKAHELLHFAKSKDAQLNLAERLFAAYFSEGRHLGSIDELADLAADVGLDRDEAAEALRSGEFADAVAADIAQARAYGISGVPFYVIDGRYGVSGAQDPDVFADALRTVATEKSDA
ncbi:protein disulfide isomerase FrnE [Gordonia sinesedis]